MLWWCVRLFVVASCCLVLFVDVCVRVALFVLFGGGCRNVFVACLARVVVLWCVLLSGGVCCCLVLFDVVWRYVCVCVMVWLLLLLLLMLLLVVVVSALLMLRLLLLLCGGCGAVADIVLVRP